MTIVYVLGAIVFYFWWEDPAEKYIALKKKKSRETNSTGPQ